MSAELVTTVVNVLISIALEVIPGIKDKWSSWRWKPLTMLGISVVSGLGMWLLVCVANVDLGMLLDCDKQGIMTALYFAVISYGANQTAFAVSSRNLPNAKPRG